MTLSRSQRTIGDLIADGAILAIQDGNHGGSHPKASEYVPDGIPFIMASDLESGRIKLESCKRLTKDRADRLRIGFAKTGDVLLTHKGTVGEVALVPEVHDYLMLTPQVTYYRTDVEKLAPRYLVQAFRSPDFQQQLDSISAQSTRPYVAISTQRHLSIPWVPLATQHRIASMLGAYDDLIEVNRCRVAVLEEMARELFEGWFVRFRFPGHESVPLVDTPHGPLPQGWHRGTVTEAFSLSRGRSYRSADLAQEGGLPFVNLKCIDRDGGFRVSGLKRYSGDYKPAHIVRRGDMVMAVTDMTQERRIVGRTGRVPLLDEPEAVISMDLVKVCPADGVDRTFLYCWLRNSDFGPTAARHANGANVLHLSPKAVVDLPITMPTGDLQEAFGRLVEPLFALAETISYSERRLAASRDLLLPRLISGQLSVEAAERELELAA